MSKNEKIAVAGFFENFDFAALAAKATDINEPNSNQLLNMKNSPDVVTQQASDRQTVTTSHSLPHDTSDGQTVRSPDDQTVIASDRQRVITSGLVTQEGSEGHYVTTSLRQVKSRTSQGVTEGQKPVLKWLVKACGEVTKIITYKMISESLSITERAARTHVEALSKKGYIFTTTATRPNSLQPIGKTVFIKDAAHLALALAQSPQSSDVVTQGASGRHYVTTPDDVTQQESDGHYVTTSDRHTLCSSSILTTTTAQKEENIPFPENDIFNRLILDDWENWDLRSKSISDHLNKDLSLLQNILDKTAYVIRQKEGTEFAIKSKIGFLKRCLEHEFCEVDSNFLSRKEKIIRQRTEQMKREIIRLQAAKDEEKNVAIELLRLKLTSTELIELRERALGQIRQEMRNPDMIPAEGMIESYENKILYSQAEEIGLFTNLNSKITSDSASNVN